MKKKAKATKKKNSMFKFEINDIVVFKHTVGLTKKREPRFGDGDDAPDRIKLKPLRYYVTDRVYEECYGGVQIHYSIRYINAGVYSNYAEVGKDLDKAREFELELSK